MHGPFWPTHIEAHCPPVVELLKLAHAPEQHCGLLVHGARLTSQEGPSSPESGGGMQQDGSDCAQLLRQLPPQPDGTQQVLFGMQIAVPEHAHA
jgi:hypothetical protein